VGAAFAVATCLLWLPYYSAGVQVFRFLTSYATDEGFGGAGSRYFVLELLRAVMPIPTPLFLTIAAALLLLIALRVAIRSKTQIADVASASMTIVGTYLLVTSPRYAWYYAWLLPFLCFAPRIAWLYLASAAALLYLVWYTPLIYPNIPLLLGCGVYIPVICLLVLRHWPQSFTRRRKLSPVARASFF
jgi:hypothetical protein